MESEKLAVNSAVIVAPGGEAVSSLIVVSVVLPEAMGASFTALTTMLMPLLSVRGPPDPVLPRSLSVIPIPAPPLKSAGGVNTMPSRAALMLSMVPVYCMPAVPFPPETSVSPVVPLSVSVPLELDNVSWTMLLPASMSLTAI